MAIPNRCRNSVRQGVGVKLRNDMSGSLCPSTAAIHPVRRNRSAEPEERLICQRLEGAHEVTYAGGCIAIKQVHSFGHSLGRTLGSKVSSDCQRQALGIASHHSARELRIAPPLLDFKWAVEPARIPLIGEPCCRSQHAWPVSTYQQADLPGVGRVIL